MGFLVCGVVMGVCVFGGCCVEFMGLVGSGVCMCWL